MREDWNKSTESVLRIDGGMVANDWQCRHWLISFQTLLIDQLLLKQPPLEPPTSQDLQPICAQNQKILLSNGHLKSVLNQDFQKRKLMNFMRDGDAPAKLLHEPKVE